MALARLLLVASGLNYKLWRTDTISVPIVKATSYYIKSNSFSGQNGKKSSKNANQFEILITKSVFRKSMHMERLQSITTIMQSSCMLSFM